MPHAKIIASKIGKTAAKSRQAAQLSKFQRYRKLQNERGLKLLRVWVLDPSHPDFAGEATKQAKRLRRRPEERDALNFIETAFSWPDE